MVLDRSKLIGAVQTSDGLWTMCKASIWTGSGSRTGGPDQKIETLSFGDGAEYEPDLTNSDYVE